MDAKYKILFLSLLLTGCANSIYFYETEKISLTVEARPDSSQPVQGNLGIKQRVAMIVPKKSDDVGKDGEALSAISSFDFRIKDVSGEFNPILVRTAFVTGEAASKLYNASDSKTINNLNMSDPIVSEETSKAAKVAKVLAYYGQAQAEIENEQKLLDRVLTYVTKNSTGAVDSGKLGDLIIQAEKDDPNKMTSTVTSKIKKTTTRSELRELLFDHLDGAIYPLYKAIPTN